MSGPDVWGPHGWKFIHYVTLGYPNNPTSEQKKHYYEFFDNLKNVLPCKYCRDNYKKNLKESGFKKGVFKNRDTLSRWVFKLHESVNNNLNKKSGLTYKEVRERYEHFRSRCVTKPKSKPKKESKKEKGCVEPLYGVKSKCVLNVIPKTDKQKSFSIDPKCKLKRGKKKK